MKAPERYETAGHIDALGRLVLQEPDLFKAAMRTFTVGAAVIVSVERHRDRRSNQANRYYWYILGLISDHTGFERDELHELFKKRFNPITVDLGGEETIGGSTKKMPPDQFYEYVERIRRFALDDLHVTTPDPASYAA